VPFIAILSLVRDSEFDTLFGLYCFINN